MMGLDVNRGENDCKKCFHGAQPGSVPGVEAEVWQGRHHE